MISINGNPIEINKFPDGTLLIKEEPSYNIALISWYFENNEELVALIYLANHLRSHGVERMELYMPYIPNARQDRVKKPEDVFTLKYFASVINSLGFDKVAVLDPHSSVDEIIFLRRLLTEIYPNTSFSSVGDFSPLSKLTVAEVRDIGYELKLPKSLIEKAPSDGLCGKTDEDNLGFTYEVLDKYIRTGEIDDDETKNKIDKMHEKNLFKLQLMPMFEYDGRNNR